MKEKRQQKATWKDLGYLNLRDLPDQSRLPDEEVVQTYDSAAFALAILEYHLGFVDLTMNEVKIMTPLGEVIIERGNLSHIVEKRRDARERYVKHALATMRDPFEIWLVEYEDAVGNGERRYAYIGAFQGKKQMLVVFIDANGKILWNFMHGDNKTLNKHRHGECVYRRP